MAPAGAELAVRNTQSSDAFAQDKIQKKWTQRQRSWDLVLAQLQLLFAEQLAS